MILYNRKKVRYRRDGYIWKKRKNERTTRVDHMKLKIQGVEVSEHEQLLHGRNIHFMLMIFTILILVSPIHFVC